MTIRGAILLAGIAIGNAAALNGSQLGSMGEQSSLGSSKGGCLAVAMVASDMAAQLIAVSKASPEDLLSKQLPPTGSAVHSGTPALSPASSANYACQYPRLAPDARIGVEFCVESDALHTTMALTLLQSDQQLNCVRR